MNIQLKKGMIEVCVLRVLSHGDSYGYKIIKDISEYIDISESTLYPVLKRLESSQMIKVYTVEHNSRLRKYYKITDNGYKKIDEFLNQWQDVMKIYNFIKGESINEQV